MLDLDLMPAPQALDVLKASRPTQPAPVLVVAEAAPVAGGETRAGHRPSPDGVYLALDADPRAQLQHRLSWLGVLR